MTTNSVADMARRLTEAANKMMKGEVKATLPFDPFAIAQATSDFALGLAARPQDLVQVQMAAAQQWSDYWSSAFAGRPGDIPRDRRFAAKEWQEDPYYRGLRDAYLLASEQMRGMVSIGDGSDAKRSMVKFLLDQYLNAVSPSNYALTNPDVVKRIKETNGGNLVQGFAHFLEDLSSGKGIVQRRTDPNAFEKGKTIAATPGEVVFENELFQLIQYTPTTPKVAAEPLLYVPPLVNRYYMIDLVPRQSLAKWLVDEGRTVFVVSWVNPTEALKDKGVEDYVVDGVVEAITVAAKRAGAKPDLFAFCLGGTLVAIALAWLAANKRGDEINSATLIGSLVDFADMRDWSAFVHEGHLTALEDHLEQQGYIDSLELQRLFAAMRANDLIWSSVVNHYLLDKPAPPSDLLYWFEDGARIPAAFLKSYNRDLLLNNKLAEPAGFEVRGTPIDLAAIKTPLLVIALKDDHVSALSAVYRGARDLGADFLLGGSGHNAGVINPPAANKHGYWTRPDKPETVEQWLAGANRHEGSWWPWFFESAEVFITDIYVLQDAAGNLVRVEKSPSRMSVIPLKEATIVTNHLIGGAFAGDEANEFRMRELTSIAREKRGLELLKSLKPAKNSQEASLQALGILRDKGTDSFGQPLHLGNRRAIDALIATHSVVFDPIEDVLYIGQGPAVSGAFLGYNLAESFRTRKPVRAGELPADPLVSAEKFNSVKDANLNIAQAAREIQFRNCDRGLEILRSISSDSQQQSPYFEALGDGLQCKGQHEDARAAWTKALALNPAYARQQNKLEKSLAK